MSAASSQESASKSGRIFRRLAEGMGAVTPGMILGTAVFVQLLLFCVRLATFPPYGDGDIFQYIGWYMVHGGTLYESCWDNKGPLVFAFSAAGMLFGETGFKVFCFLVALAILGLLYKALACRFSRSAAAWGAFAGSMAVCFIDGGFRGEQSRGDGGPFFDRRLAVVLCPIWREGVQNNRFSARCHRRLPLHGQGNICRVRCFPVDILESGILERAKQALVSATCSVESCRLPGRYTCMPDAIYHSGYRRRLVRRLFLLQRV